MSVLPHDALADPAGSVIRQLGLTDVVQTDLIQQWSGLIGAKMRGTAVDVRTGQSNPHPLAEALVATFGTKVYTMRAMLECYHTARLDAEILRAGIG